MSAATWLAVGGESLLMTSLLVALVLLIRRPVAQHFGPHLAYALWAVPLLRAILPPIPVTVVASATPSAEAMVMVPLELGGEAALTTAPSLWTELAALAMPLLAIVWLAGALTVIGWAARQHHLYRRHLLVDAVDLEPVGGIRLVMSAATPGPVSLGLWHRIIAVPQDFFARYDHAERQLAIRHELAHHKSGDLWANAAALLLLASQWFNPLAWLALRAFRFDQEAACDARVLAASSPGDSAASAARYARTIAKTAIGPRLILAAPMANSHLKERLIMLSNHQPAGRVHSWGRLLLGAGGLSALALTASALPITIASAADPDAEVPKMETRTERVVVVTNDHGDGDAHTAPDGTKKEVHRIVIRHHDKDGDAAAPHAMAFSPDAGPDGAKRVMHFRMPGGLSRDEILATLKEQGIDDARAIAIADKLEAKRKEGMARTFNAPMPPMPPMSPMPPMPPMPPMAPMPPQAMHWGAKDGAVVALADCPKGVAPKVLVDRKDGSGHRVAEVKFITCGNGGTLDRGKQISALKKARERFAKGDETSRMSAEIRTKVVADLDKAIADLEKDKK